MRIEIGDKLLLLFVLILALFLLFPLKFAATFSVLFLVAAFCFIQWNHGILKRLKISHDPPHFLFGNLMQMMKKGVHEYDMELTKKYGKIYGEFFWGGQPSILVGDPSLYRNVLVRDFNNFTDRLKFVDKETEDKNRTDPDANMFGNALTIITGDHWKNVRSTLTPAFTSGKLKQMVPLINECSEKILSVFNEKAEQKQKFDTKELFSAYTMDVVAAVAFGTKVDSIRNPSEPVCFYGRRTMQANSFKNWRFIAIAMFPCLLAILKKLFRVEITLDAEAEGFFKHLLTQLANERRKNPKIPADFMQLMINAEQETDSDPLVATEKESEKEKEKELPVVGKKIKLTENEIISQAFLFLLAGFETTATTLTFVAYNLAMKPEIQEKCAQEVQRQFSDKDTKSINYDDVMNKLPYLDATIQETLRFYPPGNRLTRLAENDYKLSDDLIIPKGCLVSIPVYAIHHSEEFYPEPEKFDPERFLPEEKAARDPYTYLPFGHGPRNCIGMRFALLEMKLLLAAILQKFKFVAVPETEIPLELKSEGVLMPKNVIYLAVEKR